MHNEDAYRHTESVFMIVRSLALCADRWFVRQANNSSSLGKCLQMRSIIGSLALSDLGSRTHITFLKTTATILHSNSASQRLCCRVCMLRAKFTGPHRLDRRGGQFYGFYADEEMACTFEESITRHWRIFGDGFKNLSHDVPAICVPDSASAHRNRCRRLPPRRPQPHTKKKRNKTDHHMHAPAESER